MLDLRDPKLVERLLNRPRRKLLGAADRAVLAGQRVLITGAGGSVGAELAREIAACRPAALAIVDQSEYALFNLELEISQTSPRLELEPVLADVTRRRLIRKVCRLVQPDVVYHAAAYKHVGMLERDACAAVQTNTLGTYYAARAARDVGSRFVLVSTDKAFSPLSVMGASKQLAERLVLSLVEQSFRPAVVRFGNVLGSSGSVVEIMVRSIARGEPIKVTHPKAARFFMSPGEAASLVVLIDVMSNDPGVYWLDMGTPVEILQLARRLLAVAHEHGYAPVPIDFCGLRPGEKLTEEFPTSDVVPSDARTSLIYRLRDDRTPLAAAENVVCALQGHVARHDGAGALEVLTATVPEFVPSSVARRAARAIPLTASASRAA